jgi:hypothetical protein
MAYEMILRLFFIYKKMATLEQLEKQKQDLINSYTQILHDSSIPTSDKVQIIKDLSRAIANITDQINKLTSGLTPEKVHEHAGGVSKEDIKEIKKDRKELQPKTIPRRAEEGKWRMDDIVRVVYLDLSQIPDIEQAEDGSIQWDKFVKCCSSKDYGTNKSRDY